MQAMILCGGAGVRLGELTREVPKPMIQFRDKPFLEYIIDYYKRSGVTDFVIPVAYKEDVIKNHFGNGSRFGVHVDYAQSRVDVESGGSFKRGLSKITSDIFVMQFGDVYFPIDLAEVRDHFLRTEKECMFVCTKREKVDQFEDKNDFLLDQNGNIILYDRGNKAGKCNVLNGGIVFFKSSIKNYDFPEAFKLEEFLVPRLIKKKQIAGWLTEKKPFDIGNIDKLNRFKMYLEGR